MPRAMSDRGLLTVRLTSDFDGLTVASRRAASELREFGLWVARLFDVPPRLIGLREHRSGHRHRGTRAWQTRNVPRQAVPLGQRTAAKLALVRAGAADRG